MTKLVAMYKKPADAAAFDAYYTATHAPLAKQLPGPVVEIRPIGEMPEGA